MKPPILNWNGVSRSDEFFLTCLGLEGPRLRGTPNTKTKQRRAHARAFPLASLSQKPSLLDKCSSCLHVACAGARMDSKAQCCRIFLCTCHAPQKHQMLGHVYSCGRPASCSLSDATAVWSYTTTMQAPPQLFQDWIQQCFQKEACFPIPIISSQKKYAPSTLAPAFPGGRIFASETRCIGFSRPS